MSTGKKIGVVDPVTIGIIAKAVLSFIKIAAPIWIKAKESLAWDRSHQLLGERMIDQIPGVALALAQGGLLPSSLIAYVQANPNAAELVDSHYKNYDTIVPMAQDILSVLFGVRIRDGSDLDNLDYGVDAYYAWRGGRNEDVPREAVERAVYLKQTFAPIRSYNNWQWDIKKFMEYPLVAPIPGIKDGSFYQGPVPGGGLIKDGIPVEPGVFIAPYGPGQTQTHGNEAGSGYTATNPAAPEKKTNWLLILAAIGIGYYLYEENQL